MITIYVGDVTATPRLKAQAQNSTARLITSENCNSLAPGVYYVSLGDLSGVVEFWQVVEQADVLIYVPEHKWSDTKNNFSYLKKWTEFVITSFKSTAHVIFDDATLEEKIETDKWKSLQDVRKTDSAQLWVAGCSISNGDGVTNSTRYGQLIADDLDLSVSFLTLGGTSLIWASDQLLRSDIRSGDIVVWGLTDFCRFPYYDIDNKMLRHVNSSAFKKDKKLKHNKHLKNIIFLNLNIKLILIY